MPGRLSTGAVGETEAIKERGLGVGSVPCALADRVLRSNRKKPGRGLKKWVVVRAHPLTGRVTLGRSLLSVRFLHPEFPKAEECQSSQSWHSCLPHSRPLLRPRFLLLHLTKQHLLSLFMEPEGPQPGSVERALESDQFISLICSLLYLISSIRCLPNTSHWHAKVNDLVSPLELFTERQT